ncbi:hypothetical protein DCC62_14785 [candidate division KSB1 bacterium]|nr:hypothetical protein [Cytophagia bacterium CHB2]RIK74707.1 MAG: hypothetical protein DCC62_14785 [candidate division KSB1 bacterium]
MMRKTVLLVLGFFALASCNDTHKIVSSGKESAPNEPLAFGLEQNYPNPFYGQTSILFSLNSAMRVRLKVMTEDWQEAATLLDARQPAGQYRIVFQAKDLPAGNYYYTMEAQGTILTREMKILK